MVNRRDGIKTLSDLLQAAANEYPEHGIGIVQPDVRVHFITYPELLSRARFLSNGLKEAGFIPGEKVILLLNRNEDVIHFFWACVLGGLVPTILQPPVSFTELNPPAIKVENVNRVLGSPRMIVSAELARDFRSEMINRQQLITTELIESKSLAGRDPVPGRETDIAFIQFSSGSTGDPKGIMLTHKNILTNLQAISKGLDFTIHHTTVNWMPLYHDMGLVGYHLAPVFGKYNQYLIDTVDFVKRPALWLDIMDRVRCTITGCPNFGQALLLRYLKNKGPGTWDLSSIKAVTNGAEPISIKVMNEFIEKMAPYGFRREAMMPVYGMAEATLAISFSPLHQGPLITSFDRRLIQTEGKVVRANPGSGGAVELVSVGKALNDVMIRIVNGKGQPLKESVVGQIEIMGDNITSGYYGNEVDHTLTFHGPWLRTGDNGFFYEDNLYITGRTKDIIFIRGQNLYAHDLENLAIQYYDIPYGKLIISGVFDERKGRDIILLFLSGSLNPETLETFQKLKTFYRTTYGITIDKCVPIRSNQIPRTSSGKIQRYRLVAAYQNGEFDEVIAEVAKLMKE
jgi:surfactin family lipopeptide synthetase A